MPALRWLVDSRIYEEEPGMDANSKNQSRHMVSGVDRAMLQFLLRARYARTYQIAGWVGSHPKYVANRLKHLKDARLVHLEKCTVRSRPDGRRDSPSTTVWVCTSRGAAMCDHWSVPSAGATVKLRQPRQDAAPTLLDHTLGVTDVIVGLRRAGWAIAAEAEIKQLEVPGQLKLRGRRSKDVERRWTAERDGRVYIPDFGLVDPRTFHSRTGPDRWVGELERRTQSVSDYRAKIAAYAGSGLGQIWMVKQQAAVDNIVGACQSLGVHLNSADPRLWTDRSGRIRVERWKPGPVITPRTKPALDAEFAQIPADMGLVGEPPSHANPDPWSAYIEDEWRRSDIPNSAAS
jgi:hypothetical protein